ncbi:E1 ubiquitin-activating protein [Salix suchowensis]|nr:E1 ubiquitin-activating protein [Salix suchowensis]
MHLPFSAPSCTINYRKRKYYWSEPAGLDANYVSDAYCVFLASSRTRFLVKNIVLTGFGHITLLDLDTIDLSNLNRQFLFRKKDVKQSKAMPAAPLELISGQIAAQTAAGFNPNVHIHPIHANIKEPQFDVRWFQGFDIVLNALDNLGDSHLPAQSMPTPVVWGRRGLVGELDDAEKQGENAQEIATLRKEAQAFKAVRSALRSPQSSTSNGGDAARMAFRKVFNADIRNLLSMSDMWRSRAPPTPLDFDAIMDGTFSHKKTPANGVNGKEHAVNGKGNAHASGSKVAEELLHSSPNGDAPNTKGLKDQQVLSLKDNLELFTSRQADVYSACRCYDLERYDVLVSIVSPLDYKLAKTPSPSTKMMTILWILSQLRRIYDPLLTALKKRQGGK